MNGELLERQYRNHLSGYMSWNQLSHAEEWVLFEKNIGPYVGIDEVSLSQGELYTILINKEKRGRSGSIIAIIKGTDVRTVTSVLLKLSRRRRFQVREIYPLGSKSNIDRIKKSLVDKEIITIEKEGIFLADSVFELWYNSSRMISFTSIISNSKRKG